MRVEKEVTVTQTKLDQPKEGTSEKVAVTLKETPDHIFETKEVSKNGKRGKFVTITQNHGKKKSGKDSGDPEVEEGLRKREAERDFKRQIDEIYRTMDEVSWIKFL